MMAIYDIGVFAVQSIKPRLEHDNCRTLMMIQEGRMKEGGLSFLAVLLLASYAAAGRFAVLMLKEHNQQQLSIYLYPICTTESRAVVLLLLYCDDRLTIEKLYFLEIK